MIVARTSLISSEVVRFAVVGLSATAIYFLAFNAVSYGTTASPVIANMVAFGLSLTVSYLGHKHVTFRAVGRHAVYLPRFVAITAVLVPHPCFRSSALPGCICLPIWSPHLFQYPIQWAASSLTSSGYLENRPNVL
jgi:putative flippase GtrA